MTKNIIRWLSRALSPLGIIAFLWLPASGLGNEYGRVIAPFPLYDMEGHAIPSPFQAAFNQPEPQFTDWDGDGWTDLFVNDRDGAVQYFKRFPGMNDAGLPDFRLVTRDFQGLDVGLWFTFYDFDNDGDADILSHTAGTDRVSYWENVDSVYTLITDALTTANGDLLYGGQVVVPTVTDINGDGIGDYFIGDISGSLTYYVGTGYTNHRPIFAFVTNQFEGIQIVWTPVRHGANAIDFFDLDNDGDRDLIWGDLYQPGLFYLENFGTATNPDFNQDFMTTNFGQLAGIQTSGFNVPRLVDLDLDGDADLVCGTLSGQYGVDYAYNLSLAENTGSAVSSEFTFVSDQLIQGLDFISETRPVVVDIDGDNDRDLLVGNAFNPVNTAWSGQVLYFKNTGNDPSPVFVLQDSMAVFNNPGSNIAPAFCDLDGDGDLDGFYGDFNGYIHEFENTGSTDAPVWVAQGNFLGLDLSGYAVPSFGDLDHDGDQDFIVGDRDGMVAVYFNQGSATQPVFSGLADLQIDLGAFAAPSYWFDNRILVGTENGELKELRVSPNTLTIIDHTIPWCGAQIAPAALYPDSTSPILVGSRDGGLQYLVPEGALNLAASGRLVLPVPTTALYPNPTNGTLKVKLNLAASGPVDMVLFNIRGQQVFAITEGPLGRGQHEFQIHMEGPSGTYLLRLSGRGWDIHKKFIYLK